MSVRNIYPVKGLKGEEIDYIYDWTDEKEKQERKESSLHLGPQKLEEEVEEVQKDKEEKVEVFEQGGNTPITVVNNYVNHVNNIVINNNNEKKEENFAEEVAKQMAGNQRF